MACVAVGGALYTIATLADRSTKLNLFIGAVVVIFVALAVNQLNSLDRLVADKLHEQAMATK
ncbi:hypothetical protein A3G63_02215 [Candidatus Kaiserbacteria bacterium RIFCSPLOWO2_12_FULL_52_8]|uniref:Uncharacterized protein n=1 Tax=Candidatus Kaiserbacteria bacterium RIFCSPHIGHO2_01_FULL_53_31 TaxID=1798481 RepID=A0A1F6CK03_9BACT|nr:MAG: hypothetical protein A2678_00075 [Candidatus Kaiserbacteria bacterium RIFCSPHIGHO2_01_FULL_53_31]OGG93011.1 MAG: hypothetical protein A3G63_02215 [Candidatus Kaiserbacteria bacterium RIFCSPLOWO2_12_FULL_52_8]